MKEELISAKLSMIISDFQEELEKLNLLTLELLGKLLIIRITLIIKDLLLNLNTKKQIMCKKLEILMVI